MPSTLQDARCQPTRWSRRLAILARIGLVAFLGVELFAAGDGQRGAVFSWPFLSLAAIHDVAMLRDWAADIVEIAWRVARYFGLLGALVAMSFARPTCFLPRQSRTVKVLVTAGVLALGLLVLSYHRLPTVRESTPVLAGLLLGVWVGGALQGGWAGVFRWILEVAALAAMLFVGSIWLTPSVTSAEPMPGLALTVNSEDKARLADVIRGQLAEATVPGAGDRQDAAVHLEFTETELNQLLSWFLATQFANCQARITLADDAVQCALSAQLESEKSRYVNVVFSGPLTIQDGQLDASVDSCRVGKLSVPPAWLENLIPPLLEELEKQSEFQRIVASIEDLKITPERAVIIGRRNELRDSVMPLLRGEFNTAQLERDGVSAQVQHLTQVGRESPPGDARFQAMLQAAFGLAQERSDENGHAVVENRAALWAMSYLIGFRRLELITGEILPGRERRRAVESLMPLTLRGREDWVKHFLISSVVTTLSNGIMSNVIGQWKERLDAQAGGSGFSFADLLADYAGRRFAIAATRNEESARRLQRAVVDGFTIDDLFPPADDLPESIPAAEWESRYGAGSGPEYQRLQQTIEQRLNSCRLLKLGRSR